MKLDVRPRNKVRKHFKSAQAQPSQSCLLVYYDGGFASLAALRAACLNAKPETHLIAIYLDVVPEHRERDHDSDVPTAAQAILAAAAVNAANYGIALQTSILECHVRGPALIHLAEQYGNATIYLGVEKDESNPFADYVRAMAPSDVVIISV